MPVLERSFFNLAVMKVTLAELLEAFSSLPSLSVQAENTKLLFPRQPYHASPSDLPMILWSPKCAPELTAFMPQVSSGDYFVLEYACKRFGYATASVRSTPQTAEWPINEFIARDGEKRQRIVRAMKDSPRWEFYAEGESLPFEVQSNYTARLVRDRFQRGALLTYLEQWGAPVRRAEFWQSHREAKTFVRQNAG